MATVKPVVFPRITSEAARPAPPRRAAAAQAKSAPARPRQAPLSHGAAQAKTELGKAASGRDDTRDKTLEAAISVLQHKSNQLYQKAGGKASPVADLGQFIDVKA